MKWDDGLHGPALRIAAHPAPVLRIAAGPGTGKTHALIRRTARLLQEGGAPEHILVTTFTRTAARDLQRALRALGVTAAERVRAGTLHATCFQVLQRADVLQVTGRVPRPLLDFERAVLLTDLRYAGGDGIRACGERLEAFHAAWARLQSEEPGWPTAAADRTFHRHLSSWLRFHQAMLIGELVPEALRYLRNNPAAPERRAFDHVLVDEYQDLNRAEQALLDLLADHATMTVVGDENQSIYSFKHAHPEGIVAFSHRHPRTADEVLRECRRCPQRVVRLANHLIGHNPGRAAQQLESAPDTRPGEILVLQWEGLEQEAAGLADLIAQRLRAGNVQAGQVLVLAPRRQIGYGIRDALQERQVPVQSLFHEEALEPESAQQSFILLTLLAKPGDRVALRCWCGLGRPSHLPGTWAHLRARCERTGEDPEVVLATAPLGQLAPLTSLYREFVERRAALSPLRGPALLDALFPDAAEWARPFRSIAAPLAEADYDAAQLYEVLRVGVTQPEPPTDVDYVRVMSLHAAKGLTADLVIVVGCIQGLLPRQPEPECAPEEQQRALEEQRRLFYVAVTRTRDTLVLSSAATLPRPVAYRMGARVTGSSPTHARAVTSQFIQELGPELPTPVHAQYSPRQGGRPA